jgi:hypothetical protein
VQNPAGEISLRTIDPERFIIYNSADERVLEEIEANMAFYNIYDGAVYLYQVGTAPGGGEGGDCTVCRGVCTAVYCFLCTAVYLASSKTVYLASSQMGRQLKDSKANTALVMRWAPGGRGVLKCNTPNRGSLIVAACAYHT